MATSTRKGSKENPITDQDLQDLEGPRQVITAAAIKDGLLHYTYKVIKGANAGDTHNVKGQGIVKDSLYEAFAKFNVHLAAIDEVFKHKGIEVRDIDKMHTDELTMKYQVSGFKIKGEEGSEAIILIGSKHTDLGVIELETPKVAMDGLSSYKWYNEIATATSNSRNEVELYMNGNFDTPEKEEKPTAKQMRIDDNLNDAAFLEAAR